MQVGTFASRCVHALSRAAPSRALKLSFLFIDGIKAVRSGQGVLPNFSELTQAIVLAIAAAPSDRSLQQNRHSLQPRILATTLV